jgi:hypothetical protein
MPLWNVLPTASSTRSGIWRAGHARPDGILCVLNLSAHLMMSAYLTVVVVVSSTTSDTRRANAYFQIKTVAVFQRLHIIAGKVPLENVSTYSLDQRRKGRLPEKAVHSGPQSWSWTWGVRTCSTLRKANESSRYRRENGRPTCHMSIA